MDEQELLTHIAILGMQLNQCMEPVLQRESREVVLARIYEAGRYPVLRDALASVRGSAHVAAIPGEGSAEGVADLLAQLMGPGASWGDDQRSRTLRAKGAFTALLELARATDRDCEPAGLAEALAVVPRET